MVCLDTDFLIAYMKGDTAAVKKLREVHEGGMASANTTVINAFELYKGAFGSTKQNEVSKVGRLLDIFNILHLDHDVSKMAGEIYSKLRTNPIEEADVLIASIALANNQTLITRNIRHFKRVPDLAVESW